MTYHVVPFSLTSNDPLAQTVSTAHHYSMLNISKTVQDRDTVNSFNRILIGTYRCRTSWCNF